MPKVSATTAGCGGQDFSGKRFGFGLVVEDAKPIDVAFVEALMHDEELE